MVYATFIQAGIQPKGNKNCLVYPETQTDTHIYIHIVELDPKFDELYHAIYTRFTTAEAYSVFPDVLGTLKELKMHGFQMGVISNSDERVGKSYILLKKKICAL